MPSGGKRPNCGRHSLGKAYVTLRLRSATISKIDRIRKDARPMKSRAEVIDEWAGKITVPGLEYLELCPVKESRFKGRPRVINDPR